MDAGEKFEEAALVGAVLSKKRDANLAVNLTALDQKQ
jgi:hypothetical protein